MLNSMMFLFIVCTSVKVWRVGTSVRFLERLKQLENPVFLILPFPMIPVAMRVLPERQL